MNVEEFRAWVRKGEAPASLAAPVAALWYDANGDWERAHDLVDELETKDGMVVHAYLHRKQGALSNADYWYERAGRQYFREKVEDEWEALVAALVR